MIELFFNLNATAEMITVVIALQKAVLLNFGRKPHSNVLTTYNVEN